jgi:hypothetical protein
VLVQGSNHVVAFKVMDVLHIQLRSEGERETHARTQHHMQLLFAKITTLRKLMRHSGEIYIMCVVNGQQTRTLQAKYYGI